MVTLPYADRLAAGRALADRLGHLAGRTNAIVLGLPRGGVPVAAEVARALSAPLDVLVVRKLGVPWHPELAMGAVASGDVRVLNDDVLATAGASEEDVAAATETERAELRQREENYRGDRQPLPVADRHAIVVDDGLATGATAAAAVEAVRARGPRSVTLAVPVAAHETVQRLRAVADEVVCVATPEPFVAVGGHYDDFAPVTDKEVRHLLNAAGTTAE